MNTNQFLAMLRGTSVRNQALLEQFIRYQAVHFDDSWQELLENFIREKGQVKPPIQVLQFETDLSAFAQASPYDVGDLATYTSVFGQAGLAKLPQLSADEKQLVVEIALYNLATRFQLLDEAGDYNGLNPHSLLAHTDKSNLVNVFRVANNLADRISRDVEEFLLDYEPEKESEMQIEVPREIHFEEEEQFVGAYLGQDLLAILNTETGQVSRDPAYQDLSLSKKSQIISYFDNIKKEKVEEEPVPIFHLGDFDHDMEMIPVYRGEEIFTYFEANGTPSEEAYEINAQEMAELILLGRSILKSNLSKLEQLGYQDGSVSESKRDILLDAVGRFHLPDEAVALLLDYTASPEVNLAMAVELLDMGLSTKQAQFFLESKLALEDMRFVGFQMLHHQVSYDVAKEFEAKKLEKPDSLNRDLMEEIKQPKKEKSKDDFSDADQVVEEVLKDFPIGSKVTYKGQEFDLVSVENAKLNHLVRIELMNDYSEIFEQNPVLYLRTFEEIEHALSLVEVEKVEEKVEEPEELNLFSFMEEETPDEPESMVEEKVEPVPPAQDFTFPADLTDFYPKTNRDKVETNLVVIRLVKELNRTNRQANPEEQELLAKYVGWGGLANDFFDENNPKFEAERLELKRLVTEREYSTMKQSSLTAYYTDPMIIHAIWQKLLDDGFEGGRILDPSMGTGNFFAAMPKVLRDKSELYGVELDNITGAIAKQLHPNDYIEVRGFEEVPFQAKSFDLVVTNVPFGNIRIADTNYSKPYMIHDYFVKHSLDLVRDGGQVALISSIGTMDKRTDNILQEIKESTDFLGGVRLPDTAFKAIAGTRVITDLLFFQKNESKTFSENELAFSGSVRYEKDARVWLNPYFDGEYNPQVLGEYEVRNFNGGTLNVKGNQEDLANQLAPALKNIQPPKEIQVVEYPPVLLESQEDKTIPSHIRNNLPLYSFGYEGNSIYYHDTHGIRRSSKVEEISYYVDEEGNFKNWDTSLSQNKIERFVALHLTDEKALDVYKAEEPSKRGKYKGLFKKTVFYESPLSDKDTARIKGMVDLRETYQGLITLQRYADYDRGEFQKQLGKLNQLYDSFVKQHGYLNATVNRNLFDSDDKYSLLASLEDEYIDGKDKKVKYKKSLAFEKALVRPEKVINQVTSALDALNSSLSDGRGVDLDYMVSIYPNHDKADILDELGDQVLVDPDEYLHGQVVYVSKPQFLSGDILSKIEVVEILIQEENQEYDWQHELALLEEVRPPRITLADIDFRIGSRWIPQAVYGKFAFEAFMDRTLDLQDLEVSEVITTNPVDGQVHLTDTFAHRYRTAKDASLGVSGSRYDAGRKIFENLLNSNQPTITMTIKDGDKKKTVTDLEKTSVLRAKEQDLQDLFQDFVGRYSDVQKMIEDIYNQLYNRTVSRTYDGSHLVIDGLAQNITLRPHQQNAIQRIVEEKRALLAHEVGSGKTLTMLGAGFKLKELGMVHKPLYVVPSSLSAQFGQEIMKFFPTKKVFVTTKKDFVKARRKQFVSRIITGDYDAIVIGDSQFEKIPVSKERQINYIVDKLNELREIKTGSKNKFTVKEAEQSIRALEQQLEELQKLNRDSFIDFENLGIDFLFVDEAHHFKNIRPITGLGNVAGITNTTSKKNVDMEMKVRQIQEEHEDKNIVFATGTPVSNSISELYTMMNYIQPDVLERYQVKYFDSWVGAFGEIQNSMELAPTGDKYQPKKRFKKFVNLPELMKIYKETADVQTQDMLDLPVPEAHIIPVESELTENQKLYLEELVMRSDAVKLGTVDPSHDNMLMITGEARKLAIDMRLLDSAYTLADNHKLLQVVDNVERIYRDGMDNKATQMIFSDIGTPKKKDDGFDVYSEIKRLLVDKGIPSKEIAFVHDANSDEKKNSLSRKVNAGEVRILLASTEKGGTGLNVQQKMKAVHHLDVPWRPSDIQRASVKAV